MHPSYTKITSTGSYNQKKKTERVQINISNLLEQSTAWISQKLHCKKYRCSTDWCTPQDHCNWTFRIKVAVLQVTHAFNPQYVSSGFLVAPIKDAFMRTSTAHKSTVCSINNNGAIDRLERSGLMRIIKILAQTHLPLVFLYSLSPLIVCYLAICWTAWPSSVWSEVRACSSTILLSPLPSISKPLFVIQLPLLLLSRRPTRRDWCVPNFKRSLLLKYILITFNVVLQRASI